MTLPAMTLALKRACRARLPLAVSSLAAATLVLSGCGGSSGTASNPAPSPTPTPTPTPTAACTVQPTTITHGPTTINTAQVVFLDPSVYPQALCNDGSPAAYILRPGSGPAASRFVINLQGGDDCYDQPSCASRAANSPKLISSEPYRNPSASTLQLSGLQGSTVSGNPDFYDATQVLALYCSSDRWSGAKAASGTFTPSDDSTWNFQGHAIVAALIADLAKNHGLSSATEILFTGGSAGGVGVYANVNAVAKLVPASARFVASSDAGFADLANDYNPSGTAPDYDTTADTNQLTKTTAGIALWNGTGDSLCAASASDPASQAACYEGSQLLAPSGTIALPMLVMEAQQDTVQLNLAGIPQADLNSGSFSTPESGYVSYFAATMRSGLNSTNGNVSLFSPDALLHEEQNSPGLFQSPVAFPQGLLTLQQAIHNWYQAPCSPQRNVAQ